MMALPSWFSDLAQDISDWIKSNIKLAQYNIVLIWCRLKISDLSFKTSNIAKGKPDELKIYDL
jgi:hypothetical protein